MAKVSTHALNIARRRFDEQAKELNLNTDFLYLATLKRLDVQIALLEALEEAIDKENTLIEKEYVKGRNNIVVNPAITEYNKATNEANKTTNVLSKIIQDRIKLQQDTLKKQIAEQTQADEVVEDDL